MKMLYHPGEAAKLIDTALKIEAFRGHKAHVVFDNEGGIMHIIVTKSEVIELPDVYNLPIQGSA
jgi:hypothetical protein